MCFAKTRAKSNTFLMNLCNFCTSHCRAELWMDVLASSNGTSQKLEL